MVKKIFDGQDNLNLKSNRNQSGLPFLFFEFFFLAKEQFFQQKIQSAMK